MKSYGERLTNKKLIFSDSAFRKIEGVKKCPICGVVPTNRYFDHCRKVFVYKHTGLKKASSGRSLTHTEYHEAKV